MTKSEYSVYEHYLAIVRNAKTDEAALAAVEVLSGMIEIITLRIESGAKIPKEN